MYYTPNSIVKIVNPSSETGDLLESAADGLCDPSTGTGAFLKHAADGLSNPPYAFQHRMHWTAVAWRKIINFIGSVVSSLRRQ